LEASYDDDIFTVELDESLHHQLFHERTIECIVLLNSLEDSVLGIREQLHHCFVPCFHVLKSRAVNRSGSTNFELHFDFTELLFLICLNGFDFLFNNRIFFFFELLQSTDFNFVASFLSFLYHELVNGYSTFFFSHLFALNSLETNQKNSSEKKSVFVYAKMECACSLLFSSGFTLRALLLFYFFSLLGIFSPYYSYLISS